MTQLYSGLLAVALFAVTGYSAQNETNVEGGSW